MTLIGSLRDARALAGAAALIIVGAHLSVMMAFYFYGDDTFQLMQARWWWEISLNIQILVLVLMWICHHERVKEASGWRKARAVLRFTVGIGGVLIPVFVLVLHAQNNWGKNPPAAMELAYYAGLVFAGWAITAYGIPLLLAAASRQMKFARLTVGAHERHKYVQLVPFSLLALLVAIEEARGGKLHFVLWPFLTYLHGSIPYVLKAYATEAKQQSRATGEDEVV